MKPLETLGGIIFALALFALACIMFLLASMLVRDGFVEGEGVTFSVGAFFFLLGMLAAAGWVSEIIQLTEGL